MKKTKDWPMFEWLKRWYGGRTEITEFDNNKNDYVFIMPLVTTEYHWTAKLARVFVGFYFAHWQWIWGILLSVAALYISLLQLRQGEAPKPQPAIESAATVLPVDTRTSNIESAKNVSIHEIFHTIRSAPPLQQQALAQNYVGINIDWNGYLKTAELSPSKPETITVNLNSSKDAIVDYSVWFTVPANNAPEIRSLHKQSKVRVVGQINSISIPGVSVTVTPSKVEVLDRSQNSN